MNFLLIMVCGVISAWFRGDAANDIIDND